MVKMAVAALKEIDCDVVDNRISFYTPGKVWVFFGCTGGIEDVMEDVKVALLSFFLARGRVFQGLRDCHHQQGPDSVCGVNPFSMDPIGEGNLLKNSSVNSVF